MPDFRIRTPETMRGYLKDNPGVGFAYLKTAEGGVYLKPTLIQTVLGSCLGVAFHVPEKRIGAFFHGFLPRCADFGDCGGSDVFRYVDFAVDYVMDHLARLGISPDCIRVSLVGGANGMVDDRAGVGGRNIEVARERLDAHGLAPHYVDVGGHMGRKVFFLTASGEIRVTMLHGLAERQGLPPRNAPKPGESLANAIGGTLRKG